MCFAFSRTKELAIPPKDATLTEDNATFAHGREKVKFSKKIAELLRWRCDDLVWRIVWLTFVWVFFYYVQVTFFQCAHGSPRGGRQMLFLCTGLLDLLTPAAVFYLNIRGQRWVRASLAFLAVVLQVFAWPTF